MVLHGHYNPWLVGLSYLIACGASWGALRLMAASAPADDGAPAEMRNILPAATMLGMGIWAMHFTGMAAFSIPGMPLGFRWDITVLSLLVAIVFTGFGFATLALARKLRESFVLAGIPMACGILTMHFLGMMAMTGDMEQHYRADLVLVSALIALTASIAALWLTTRPHRMLRSLVSAMLMALAICGMHYTGMEAAIFTATPGHLGAMAR